MKKHDEYTHVFCESCSMVRPAIKEPLEIDTINGEYVGGDIVCEVCGLIVASVYAKYPIGGKS